MPPKRKAETATRVRMYVQGKEVFTTEQVAHALNISVRTVLRAIHIGTLKAYKVGRQFLITRAAVRVFWKGLAGKVEESSDKTG
jgi:excisionase family DNA binding protein